MVFGRSTCKAAASIRETHGRFQVGRTHVALNPDGLPVGFRFGADTFRPGASPGMSARAHVDVVTPRGVFRVSRDRGLRLIDACKPLN